MAHPEQAAFFQSVKDAKPEFFSNVFVIDIGSLDINGNNGFLFDNANYIGVDIGIGKNVDVVSKGHEVALPDGTFDVVISSECFEHDMYYAETIRNMYRMLKPGGIFLFSCATTGRPEHGTRRTSPKDAPLLQQSDSWADYYLNLTEADIRAVLDVDVLFKEYQFELNHITHDIYFYGVKNGDWIKRYNYSTAVNQSLSELLVLKLVETNSNLVQTNTTLLETAKVESSLAEMREGALNQELNRLNHQIYSLYSSSSWRVSAPLRHMKKLAKITIKLVKTPSLCASFIRSARKNGVRHALSVAHQVAITPDPSLPVVSFKDVVILTREHCLYVAQLIKVNLNKVGINAEIITSEPRRYKNKLHFVICPQIYSSLPDHYISFQMEQSVNPRWFNDKYFSILENSYAVFDYSLENISFLQEKGLDLQKTHYMPISYNFEEGIGLSNDQPLYDVLFYGDFKCERRQVALEFLQKKHSVKVINNLYGDALKEELKRAKVIVNVHYYEGALLETTRLYECLSLGLPVVSEKSVDMENHSNLEEVVEFFELGDFEGMASAVEVLLKNAEEGQAKNNRIKMILESQPNWFEFYFMRFLLSVDAINFDEFYRVAGKNITFESDFVCLGLPESSDRRQSFLNEKIDYIHYFPGLRHQIGWVGCALSYKFIMQKSKEQGFKKITVCEDDVEFLDGWEERYSNALSYLEHLNDQGINWDIFAGLIAEINEKTEVSNLAQWKETEYVHINKMVSMVFNVYSGSFFDRLINWDEKNRHQETNQIDRYVEGVSSLQVVTTLPYIVGHKEEQVSTLWGRKNNFYNEYFAKSAKVLSEKIQLFKSINSK